MAKLARPRVKRNGATVAAKEARGPAGTAQRVRDVGRQDRRDALEFCSDLLLAMILRERVALAAQPQATRALARPEQSIENRLLASLARFRTADELVTTFASPVEDSADKSPNAELRELWRKLDEYTMTRTREMLGGLGAQLRQRRRRAELQKARRAVSVLEGLPKDAQGRNLARIYADLEAAALKIEALDLPGVPDIHRQQLDAFRAGIEQLVGQLGPLPGASQGIARSTVGRAAGFPGAEKDVAKEVDRIEQKRIDRGMLTTPPLDPRLLR